MIWIVGECAERIDNADELLESFLEGFHEERPKCSPLLTAIVELSLKKPSETQWELVSRFLNLATQILIILTFETRAIFICAFSQLILSQLKK